MDAPESLSSSPNPLVEANPWSFLRQFTPARLALGRAGGSQPTQAVLEFRRAHAQARDAVRATWDLLATSQAISALGLETQTLATEASDRDTHLRRPDLGRRLSSQAREQLTDLAVAHPQTDLVLILSDGLSATAIARHGAPLVAALIPRLQQNGWSVAPVILCPFGRVKLQDEIGSILGAKYALMILGERPGLSSSDSLGAYFTAHPHPSKTDADRNCLSNIRPEGLSPEEAATKLVWLLGESRRTGRFGVALKDTTDQGLLPKGD